jgi:Lon protease-like protein
MTKIGLFPLGLVLLPNSTMALYIFEERYKRLINECWENQKPFGIILQLPNKNFQIGCTAFVSDIMNVKANGNMEILITGKNRFKISKIHENEAQYLVAEIDWFNDKENIIDNEILGQALTIYNEIAQKVKQFKIPEIHIESIGTVQPSFLIAQKSGLSLEERQALLEIRSENERLAILLAHLKAIWPLIEQAEIIQILSKNDGYLVL